MSYLLGAAGDELPDRAHHRVVDLAGEVEHARETGQHLLALVVVIAEGHAQFVGDRPLLDPADEDVDLLLLEEGRELEGIGVVDDDRSLVGVCLQFFVIFRSSVCDPTITTSMPIRRKP